MGRRHRMRTTHTLRAVLALGDAIAAHDAMLRAHRCLRLHARTHGVYPDTLDALGTCLGPSADGFTLTYDRRGDGFELRALIGDLRRELFARADASARLGEHPVDRVGIAPRRRVGVGLGRVTRVGKRGATSRQRERDDQDPTARHRGAA